MLNKKPTLEQRISAVVARHVGTPYAEVLEISGLTPMQFLSAVRDLPWLALSAPEEAKSVLEEILADDKKVVELFRMGDELIRGQCITAASVARRKVVWRKRFYDGAFLHPENQELIAYYTLSLHNPELASGNRAMTVRGINNLPMPAVKYLRRMGLGGLMVMLGGSPWAVLQAFDRAYKCKSGDVSLFDLTQQEHLHEWGDNLHAPREYWQSPGNVQKAISHLLQENNPQAARKLASIARSVYVYTADHKT